MFEQNWKLPTLLSLSPPNPAQSLPPPEQTLGVCNVGTDPAVLSRVIEKMPLLNAQVLGVVESPILGGKAGKSSQGTGNREWLVLLQAARPA